MPSNDLGCTVNLRRLISLAVALVIAFTSICLTGSTVAAEAAEGTTPGAAPPSSPTSAIAAAPELVVRAKGDTGEEIMAIQVDDQTIATAHVSKNWGDYSFQIDPDISLAHLRIAFTNDQYKPPHDRNLRVDWIEWAGTRYESEAPTTHSTGTWNAATGCAPGFKTSETLSCNGHFTYQAVTSSDKATVKIAVSAPAGIPASVTLHGGPTDLLAVKTTEGEGSSSDFEVVPGDYEIVAPPETIDGRLYLPEPKRAKLTVEPGGTATVAVTYTPSELVRDFHVTGVDSTTVALTWTAQADTDVAIRRTAGEEAAASVDDGVEVPVVIDAATDTGLTSGDQYTYALFVRQHGSARWEGPTVIRVGTTSPDDRQATYVANQQTILLDSTEIVTAEPTGNGVHLVLRPGLNITPVVGAAVVVPVTENLPGGFLGRITTISPDGLTLDLVAGGLSDAFDYYNLSVAELGDGADGPDGLAPLSSPAKPGDRGDRELAAPAQTDPPLLPAATAAPSAVASSLLDCFDGGSVGQEFEFDPAFSLEGHFNAAISKYSVFGIGSIPTGASFDTELAVVAKGAATLKTSAAISCDLIDLPPAMIPIATGPVPIFFNYSPTAEISVGGAIEVSDAGFTVKAGMEIDGHFGWSDGADFSANPILEATPYAPTTVLAGTIGLKVGGEVIIGPGAGTPKAGVIAGISGELNPIDAHISAVFPLDDPRFNSCLRADAAMTLGLSLKASAWLGKWEVSKSITLDALQGQLDYPGSPWYLPSGCEAIDTPGDSALGAGVTKVTDNLIGSANQWGYLAGLVPAKKTWVLSTGNITDVVGEPGSFASTNLGAEGDEDLSTLAGRPTFDAVGYEATIVPSGSTLHIRYVFASEEYPEYVGSQFNDVMAVYVNGQNCGLVPDTTAPVSVNTINANTNSNFFVDNQAGAAGYNTVMDGLTTPLECIASVEIGKPVSIKIAVADASDHVYDSAVALLDQGIWSE